MSAFGGKTGLLIGLGVAFAVSVLAEGDPDYEWLVRLIQKKRITTVEQVLAELPPSYLSHFTLMHASQSAQGATPRLPRAIVFGETASLILAFNGGKRQAGYQALELIQFRANEARFEFRRIEFPDPNQAGAEVVFSGKNPRRCLGCHEPDPRPNWAFYKSWPGAYGEDDDVPKGPELSDFLKFQTEGLAEARYRSLKPPAGSILSPYETQDRGRLRFRPNLRLMVLSFGHNADRLVRLLRANPHYEAFQYLFLLSRLQCDWGPLSPEKEFTSLFGPLEASLPLGHWRGVTAESLYAYLIRAAGISDADWSMGTDGDGTILESWGPYTYFLGAALFEKFPLLQADAVVARMVESLLPAVPALKPYYRPASIAEERFAADALDLPLARKLDGALRSIDFQRLRSACPILLDAQRKNRPSEQ